MVLYYLKFFVQFKLLNGPVLFETWQTVNIIVFVIIKLTLAQFDINFQLYFNSYKVNQ